MGAQKLDAFTETKGYIELQRANGQRNGALSFHLDTHGYNFDRPGELSLRPVWQIWKQLQITTQKSLPGSPVNAA